MQPKRLTTKNIKNSQHSGSSQAQNKFVVPPTKFDLDLLAKKEQNPFTPHTLTLEVFGEEGLRMTEQEKVYHLVSAMKDLEMVLPFEFECEHCKQVNPIAIEIAKVMSCEGESLNSFNIEVKDYYFEFTRPSEIHEVPENIEGLTSIAFYALQWLSGHNKGEDFDFMSLPLPIAIKVFSEFAKNIFKVHFHVDSTCNKCNAEIKEDFNVTLSDLTEVINEL